MSEKKTAMGGIQALLLASKLLEYEENNQNLRKTKLVNKAQKSILGKVGKMSGSVEGMSVSRSRKPGPSMRTSVTSRKSDYKTYTCVRIKFHRIQESQSSNKRGRTKQEEETHISHPKNTPNANHLLLQKVSQSRQRKRCRKERSIAQLPPMELVPPKVESLAPPIPIGVERLEPRRQRTSRNRRNLLNLAHPPSVELHSSNGYYAKEIVKLLNYTQLSCMIVSKSICPEQHRDDTFYSRLMSLMNDDIFECEINWADSMNITILMLACSLPDNVQMVRDLLFSGANPFTFDILGRSPLHYAAEVGSLEVCKILVLSSGVPVDIHIPGLNWTPLLSAAVNKRWDSVKLLTALAIATKQKLKKK